MVVDVVQCSQNAPQLKRVVQFVCGNSLVCENLKDARHVAFDGPERLKVRFRHGCEYVLCAMVGTNKYKDYYKMPALGTDTKVDSN